MACFYCQECDRLIDGDYTESYEWDKGEEICIDCHIELTPEDWDDYLVSFDPSLPKSFQWSLTHKDYDGAPIDSFGPPADGRFFMGPSIKDVYQQAIEYNEDRENGM